MLPHIAKLYAQGVPAPHITLERQIPQSIARMISEQPNKYPLQLVASADGELRSATGTNAEKLLEVARTQKWFKE
jgi:hypothetical protein